MASGAAPAGALAGALVGALAGLSIGGGFSSASGAHGARV